MCDCLLPLIVTVLLVDFVGNHPRLCAVFQVVFTLVSFYIVYLYPKHTWDTIKYGINIFFCTLAECVNWCIAIANDMAGTNLARIMFIPL